MTPEQIKACRAGLRLTQAEFGKRIGVSRSSAIQYESGQRLDTKQPIEISKTTNMACGSAWLDIGGFDAVIAAADRADYQTHSATPILPSNSVPSWHLEAAVQELERRGFKLSEYRLGFPLLATMALWAQIARWCPERGMPVPNLYPVISVSVPGLAILEFATEKDAADFIMFCTGGR